MTLKKTILRTGALVITACLIIAATSFGLFTATEKKHGVDDRAIPVRIAKAERRNAPNYVNAIGTVQALNTVVVRARVDGELNLVRFQEGTYVKHGDILVELDKRPFEVQVRAAVAQKEKDEAQLENTQLDLERYESLLKQDSIAKQTVDATRALLDQTRATVSADQAQIDMAQLQLDYATIRSPIDGRLGARLVDAGNVVHANDPNGLVIVSQIQPVFVTFSIPQNSLALLLQQQSRRDLQVVALNQDGSQVLDDGKLSLIESQIDSTTGTVRCKATFRNAKEKLWPGAFVTVRIVLNELLNVVLVPTTAIQAGAQQPFVYVIDLKNRAEARKVEVGPVSGSQTVISSGLAEGERVVVEGQFQLGDGVQVEVKNEPPTVLSGKPGDARS